MHFWNIFRKKPLENSFRGYIFENVYHNMPIKTREEIIRFWLNQKVLKEEEANRRVDEVAFVIRSKSTGDIAGVNTVYVKESEELKGRYYFYRIFIHPEHRGSFKMIEFVTYQTFLFLKKYKTDDPKPEGLVMVIENPKFYGKRARKWLSRLGLIYHGDDFLGREIWYIPFNKRPAYRHVNIP